MQYNFLTKPYDLANPRLWSFQFVNPREKKTVLENSW